MKRVLLQILFLLLAITLIINAFIYDVDAPMAKLIAGDIFGWIGFFVLAFTIIDIGDRKSKKIKKITERFSEYSLFFLFHR